MERLGDVLRKFLPPEWRSADWTADGSELPDNGCPRCEGVGYVRRDVPVDHPDFGKAFPCRCREAEIAERRRERLERLSNLGPLTRLTFDSFIPEGRHADTAQQRERFRRALEAARSFAEKPNAWLVLAGPPGCGKTHLAAAIANARLAVGEPVLFVVVPDFLDHLRATFGPTSEVSYDELFEVVRLSPLLVLDDLGTQSTTPWAAEKLYQLFNARFNSRLPTVVTTNRPFEEIEERLRVRLRDPDLAHVCWVDAPQPAALQRLDSLPPLERRMKFEGFETEGAWLEGAQQRSLREALDAAVTFARSPAGWLVFQGPSGSGKTHLAAAITNARLDAGSSAVFICIPDLLDHLRSTYAPESPVTYDQLFDTIRTAPLLILDDLGAHSGTAWAQEKLYQLFNYRYNAELPTVITTNLPVDALEPRLASRLRDGSLSRLCEILAPHYRRRGSEPRKSGALGDAGRVAEPRPRGYGRRS